jgi:hypothetical protein
MDSNKRRPLMPEAKQEEAVVLDINNDDNRNDVVVPAIQEAKAKNARLRLMKERNENYLAERRDEDEADNELTKELCS